MRRGRVVLLAVLLAVLTDCRRKPAPVPVDGNVAPLPVAPDGASSRDLDRQTSRTGPCPRRPEVVRFRSEDGVELEGDLYGSGKTNGPAALLLHMIPPRYDRTSYPATFIEALGARGITVLNVDRRGAGKSGGEPRAAYLGPSARLDAAAAFGFLRSHRCKVDPHRIAIVGASNGTTTALDHTLYATRVDRHPPPRALVLLTGGSYTEKQNRFARNRAVLDPIPLLFVYSTAERSWSAALARRKSPRWTFREYRRGAHGTRLFETRPDSVAHVVDFLSRALR